MGRRVHYVRFVFKMQSININIFLLLYWVICYFGIFNQVWVRREPQQGVQLSSKKLTTSEL